MHTLTQTVNLFDPRGGSLMAAVCEECNEPLEKGSLLSTCAECNRMAAEEENFS